MRCVEAAVFLCLTGKLLDQILIDISQYIVVTTCGRNEVDQIYDVSDRFITGPGNFAKFCKTRL